MNLGNISDNLKELSDKYALDLLPVAVVITDLNAKIVFVNKEFSELTGYSSDEVIGKNTSILNSSYHDDSFFKEMWNTVLSGQNWQGEICNRRKDGSIYWEKLKIAPAKDSNNNIYGFISIKIDISKSKESELKLRESEEKYKLLFNNLNNTYALMEVVNMGTDDADAVFLDVNAAVNRFAENLNPENVIGRTVRQVFPNIELHHFKYHEEVVRTQQSLSFEMYSETLKKHIKFSMFPFEGNKIGGIATDITKEKEYQKQLERSELMYRSLFENMQSAFVLFKVEKNANGENMFKFEQANKTFERELNFNFEDICGNYLTHEYDRENDNWLPLLEEVLESRKATQFTFYSKSFQKYYNQVAYIPMKGYIAVIFDDVSEKILKEQRLTESEELFRLAFDNSNVGICLVDTKGKLFRVNQQMCKMFGYSKEELENMYVSSIAYKEDIGISEKFIDKSLKSSENQLNVEKRYIHKSGELVTCLLNASLVKDEEGNPKYFISQLLDISERKKSEELLRISEERFNLAVSGAKDGIWDWDLTNNTVYYSSHWKSMLGYDEDEILPDFASFENLLHPEDKKFALENIQKYLSKEIAGFEMIIRMKAKSGEYRWIHTRGEALFDKDENAYRMCGSHTDVTENIIAAQKLKELNATKDKFFSIIAHDLRNPFNVLNNYLDILVKDLDHLEKDDIKEIISDLHSTSKSTYDLLNNLLTWSRTQTNKLKLNIEKYNLLELVKFVKYQIANQAKQKRISIELNSKQNIYVNSDRAMIETVIRNIISNAIKFTNEDGKVTIDIALKSNFAVVSISDTGVGMDKETVGKLFKIEEDVSTLGTNLEKGTGLGLILCREFVERNNGSISCESELSKGSKFIFTVPLAN